MHQKYTMVFPSNTNFVFVIALNIFGFSISFSSLFKILFHNFGARIVIVFLLLVSLKLKDTVMQIGKALINDRLRVSKVS